MAFSYNSAALATALNHVRFLIQDTTDSGHFFEDTEITFAIAQEANVYRVAADLCRQIAAKLAKTPSLEESTVQFDAEKSAATYLKLAEKYETKADEADASLTAGTSSGMSFPTMSVEDKDPAFTRDLHYS